VSNQASRSPLVRSLSSWQSRVLLSVRNPCSLKQFSRVELSIFQLEEFSNEFSNEFSKKTSSAAARSSERLGAAPHSSLIIREIRSPIFGRDCKITMSPFGESRGLAAAAKAANELPSHFRLKGSLASMWSKTWQEKASSASFGEGIFPSGKTSTNGLSVSSSIAANFNKASLAEALSTRAAASPSGQRLRLSQRSRPSFAAATSTRSWRVILTCSRIRFLAFKSAALRPDSRRLYQPSRPLETADQLKTSAFAALLPWAVLSPRITAAWISLLLRTSSRIRPS